MEKKMNDLELVKEFNDKYSENLSRFKLENVSFLKADIGKDYTDSADQDKSAFTLKSPEELKFKYNQRREIVKRVSISRPDLIKIIADENLLDEVLVAFDNFMTDKGCTSYTYKPPGTDEYLRMFEGKPSFELRCVGYIL